LKEQKLETNKKDSIICLINKENDKDKDSSLIGSLGLDDLENSNKESSDNKRLETSKISDYNSKSNLDILKDLTISKSNLNIVNDLTINVKENLISVLSTDKGDLINKIETEKEIRNKSNLIQYKGSILKKDRYLD